MKGLDICRGYFAAYGPRFLDAIGSAAGHIACALTGSGSECMGYDDEVSRDHDFEPGFLVVLPGEDVVSSRVEFAIGRAYRALPDEYSGCRREKMPLRGRRGVIRAAEFLRDRTGSEEGFLSLDDWCRAPQYAIGEAVNGCVFYDPSGFFTAARERLSLMPADARRKRLAGQLVLMDQSGFYNYDRTLAHGEQGAAQLAVIRFCDSAAEAAFLVMGRYRPYYKWEMRALRESGRFPCLPAQLDFLLTNDNMDETRAIKRDVMRAVAGEILRAAAEEGLTKGKEASLSEHAAWVNEGIQDADLRGRGILYAT